MFAQPKQAKRVTTIMKRAPADATPHQKVLGKRKNEVDTSGHVKQADTRFNMGLLLDELEQSVVPSFCCCFLTKLPMKDPVMMSDGNSYEREAILLHLSHNKFSPITQKLFPNERMVDNIALREAIKELGFV